MNGKEPITYQGALDEPSFCQTLHGKSKAKISLCKRKIYQRIDLEEICSRFDQVRPVVSHLEVIIPNKPLDPNGIGESLKGPQRQL